MYEKVKSAKTTRVGIAACVGVSLSLAGCFGLSDQTSAVSFSQSRVPRPIVGTSDAGGGDGGEETNPIFARFQKIVETRCSVCHNGMTVPSDYRRYKSEGAWVRSAYYVLPGDPDGSPIYHRLKGSMGSQGPKNMPSGPGLTDDELNAIRVWILSLAGRDFSESDAGTSELSTYVSVIPRAGDRYFVAEKLRHVFGDGAKPIAQQFILEQLSVFSGGCDLYEQSLSQGALEYPELDCRGMRPADDQTGKPNALSEVYRVKACESLVSNPALLNAALSRIPGVVSSNPPVASSITSAYQRFYPVKPPSAEEVQALLNIAGLRTTATEKWKAVLLTLCLSPEWQIP